MSIVVSRLREQALRGNPDLADETSSIVGREELLALVQAVDAARDYFAQSLPYECDEDAEAAQERLRAALRPFTFAGYA